MENKSLVAMRQLSALLAIVLVALAIAFPPLTIPDRMPRATPNSDSKSVWGSKLLLPQNSPEPFIKWVYIGELFGDQSLFPKPWTPNAVRINAPMLLSEFAGIAVLLFALRTLFPRGSNRGS